ncbi:MAG TPA: PLP-dependent aminotransferase family protein [Streptosporangiaceae bacterium]|nr:PLP-dependent aminotransferase family protein [Streptosporangiaceae bacterium]
MRPRARLCLTDLHGSLSDPVLDTMNFLNEVTARFPEAISFAPGRPHEGSFDPGSVGRYLRTYTSYLARERGFTPAQVTSAVFQYGRTKGQIHELLARTLGNDEGIWVPPEAIVVTVGAQEAMLLVLRALFAGPADVLLASSPCYVGITGAARLLDIEVVPVAEGDTGPDPDAIADAAQAARAAGRRPRVFYVVPDFANPSGASMTVHARQRLLDVAAAQDLLVVEDNPYGFFTRDVSPRPTLKSLDRDCRVIYLGSFAKTCFPGARLGYVVADQDVAVPDGSRRLLADELAKVKSMVTVNTASLSQAVVAGMLIENGYQLRSANEAAAAFYRANMQAVLTGLGRYFPAGRHAEHGVSWNSPDGGFFVVVTVPFAADDAALEVSAREYGVLWTPMRSFYAGREGDRQLRLSCSYVSPGEVAEGMRRLAAFIMGQRAS